MSLVLSGPLAAKFTCSVSECPSWVIYREEVGQKELRVGNTSPRQLLQGAEARIMEI